MVQFSTFVRGRVALAAALVLAAPLAAQGKGSKDKKPKKGGEPAAAAPAKVKDDAVTAKDKAIVALDKFSAAHKVDTKRDGWRQGLTAPEQQVFAKDREYQWHLETNKGELTIRLRPDVAPMHVTSAIYLTRLGYYDGLTFHRVIKDFMAQGGCPLGNGNGGPGYTMAGEFAPDCKHDKPGILSTANEEGKPHTDGSQFFLTFVPTPHLDGKHTIFGEVTGGLDVLEAIAKCAGGDSGVPTEKLAIVRAWVVVVDPSAAAGKDGKDGKDKGADGKSSGGKAGGGKDAGKGK